VFGRSIWGWGVGKATGSDMVLISGMAEVDVRKVYWLKMSILM
jgi:hypothetical protein